MLTIAILILILSIIACLLDVANTVGHFFNRFTAFENMQLTLAGDSPEPLPSKDLKVGRFLCRVLGYLAAAFASGVVIISYIVFLILS